jgi:hypothetical protein
MSIIHIEGFELFNSSSQLAYKGASYGSYTTSSITTGRNSGQALSLTSAYNYGYPSCSWIVLPLYTSVSTTGTVGFAFKYSSTINAYQSLVSLCDSSNNMLYTLFFADGLSSYNYGSGWGSAGTGSFFIGQTSFTSGNGNDVLNNPSDYAESVTVPVSTNTWYYVEWSWSSSNMKLTFQAMPIINYNFTTGITSVPRIMLMNSLINYNYGSMNSDSNIYFDDIYVSNSATASGQIQIAKILPSSDSSVSFARSTGANNYSIVANNNPEQTSGYLTASSNNTSDKYGITGATGTILGVNLQWASFQTQATGNFCPLVNIGGTDYLGTAIPNSPSLAVNNKFYSVKPSDSSSWSASDVNSAKFGVQFTSP